MVEDVKNMEILRGTCADEATDESLPAAIQTPPDPMSLHPSLDDTVPFQQDIPFAFFITDTERWTLLNKHGNALLARFKTSARYPYLEEAISLHRKALSYLPIYHTKRELALNDLAEALMLLFEKAGRLRVLNEAISLFREVLALQPIPHPDRLSALNNLIVTLKTRFELLVRVSDLNEIISLQRDVLTLQHAYHPDRLFSLISLAFSLSSLYKQTHQIPDLNETISIYHESLQTHSLFHTDRPQVINNLGTALHSRFEEMGQSVDLDTAISLFREALVLLPTSDPERLFALNNLAASLSTMFRRTGKLPVLDEAISLLRKALILQPTSHPQRANSLINLATALHARFVQASQPSDLDETISLLREAIILQPPSHPDRSSSLNNLAATLKIRSESKDNPDQLLGLDEVISLHREALALRPRGHQERYRSISNLAMALRARFDLTHHIPNLEEAVLLHREALNSLFKTQRDRPFLLENLAGTLRTRYYLSYQISDVEEAITLCREALEVLPKDHPGICSILITLGGLLLDRFHWNHNSGAASEKPSEDIVQALMRDTVGAANAFRTAAHCESAPIVKRFYAARRWARLSPASDMLHGATLEAYEMAVQFLPRIAALDMNIESRQRALAWNTDGLAGEAAAYAIQSKKFKKAVELLEAGRATFWSQALQLRTPLDELQAAAPELAKRLRNISHALERGSLRDSSRSISDPQEKIISMEQEAVRYRQLSSEWLSTVEEARKLGGFGDFLCAKSFATLSAAAAHGPVVILNANGLNLACDALVIMPSEDLVHIPLTKLNRVTLKGIVQRMRALSDNVFPRARGDRAMKRAAPDQWDADRIFRSILEKLWRLLVCPIFESLGLSKTDSPPRLWWMPTGPFTSLPIHAAGIYDIPGGDCVADYVVSSYTPTLGALLTPSTLKTQPCRMLAAIQPVTKGHGALPYTQDELRQIDEHVPPSVNLHKFGLPDRPPSVKTMLSELPKVSIVHLACHGQQNTRHPLDGALLFENEQLKVAQLMQLSMPNASLVFLSACETAKVDDKLPDEPIHLAATLIFAGFRGAVATMWSMEDEDGPIVAGAFYQYLFSPPECVSEGARCTFPDTRRAAQALHIAVGRLRDTLHREETPSRFTRWVPFVHFGL